MLEYLQCQSYFKLVNFVQRLIEVKFQSFNKALENVEKRSRINKTILIHAIVSVTLVFSVVTYLGPALRYISGFLYPAFYTMEAMNTKNQEQINRWLKYWTVYGFLQVFEGFADHSLGFLPLFHFIKALFVLWMHFPTENNGANFVYNRYMMPAWEMMKNNSLDTIGSKALDELGKTLKIQMSDTNVSEKVEDLKKEVVKAVTDTASSRAQETAVNAISSAVKDFSVSSAFSANSGSAPSPAVK